MLKYFLSIAADFNAFKNKILSFIVARLLVLSKKVLKSKLLIFITLVLTTLFVVYVLVPFIKYLWVLCLDSLKAYYRLKNPSHCGNCSSKKSPKTSSEDGMSSHSENLMFLKNKYPEVYDHDYKEATHVVAKKSVSGSVGIVTEVGDKLIKGQKPNLSDVPKGFIKGIAVDMALSNPIAKAVDKAFPGNSGERPPLEDYEGD